MQRVIKPGAGESTNGGTVIFSPGYINLGPAVDGTYAVLRYTVPDSGTYNIAGAFRGQDSVGATTDVYVLFDSNSAFDGYVTGTGDPSAQSFALDGISLNAGDTIDVAVGTGGNGYAYDNTGFQANITAAGVNTPEPCSVLLVSGGIAALVGLRRRVRQQ